MKAEWFLSSRDPDTNKYSLTISTENFNILDEVISLLENKMNKKDEVFEHCGEILFSNHRPAQELLTKIQEHIYDYGSISVEDVYRMAGITKYDYTCKYYVWTTPKNMYVKKVGNKTYKVILPTPKILHR